MKNILIVQGSGRLHGNTAGLRMRIRAETEQDYADTEQVVRSAFEHAEHADGNESELVHDLRSSAAFIPELSLVAEADGIIIGHIMFTRAYVEENVVLALAPLSVLPEYQRHGIGKALIAEGHRIAGKAGYAYSVVLGDTDYYGRMGYSSAGSLGINAPPGIQEEYLMACKLRDKTPVLNGIIRYAAEFGLETAKKDMA